MRIAIHGLLFGAALLTTLACADIVVAPPPDGAPSEDVQTGDGVVAPDLTNPTDLLNPPPDVPGFDIQWPDTGGAFAVAVAAAPELTCTPWVEIYGGELAVTLRWQSNLPALCNLRMQVPEQEPRDILLLTEEPVESHEYTYTVTFYDYWARAPRRGDTIEWVAVCQSNDGEEASSEPMRIVLEDLLFPCLWPFDETCSDDAAITCGAPLSTCDEGLVPVAIGGCGLCLYPNTCTCSDVAELNCGVALPVCDEPMVLAQQGGACLCVNPFTCRGESVVVCSPYVTSRAECYYQLVSRSSTEPCERSSCRTKRCASDEDCGRENLLGRDRYCVYGHCAECYSDTQCFIRGQVCRGGRCVFGAVDGCPEAPRCSGLGCRLVTMSDVPCPVCVCGSSLGPACETLRDCPAGTPFLRYNACISGSCAECRTDGDCESTESCVMPGFCQILKTDVDWLMGTWLLSHSDPLGQNHASYFRFEPDGTLRRGRYDSRSDYIDDLPPICQLEQLEGGLLGTWRVITQSSVGLQLTLTLNHSCLPDKGWEGRFQTNLPSPGATVRFTDENDSMVIWSGTRITGAERFCTDDMRECVHPDDLALPD